MKLVPVLLAIVVLLSFVGSPKASNSDIKAMTEAAYNIKVWQSHQKTVIAKASATSTPIRTVH